MSEISGESIEACARYRAAWEAHPFLYAQHGDNSYPDSEDDILEMIRSHFASGVGTLPPEGEICSSECPPGLVVPHLDFRVGGHVYSHAYDALLRGGPADLYVILGVGHQSAAEISVLKKGYRTCLGETCVDEDFFYSLRDACGFEIGLDPFSHHGEHSIEFVVVYLQALGRLFPRFAPFRILPVLCGGMHEGVERGTGIGSDYHQFAEALRGVVAGYSGRVCVIGSIDGSHVGPRFGHPFKVNKSALGQVRGWDEQAFLAAEHGDPEAFIKSFGQTRNAQFFDGVGVLFVMLHMFREIARFRLQHYDQWFEKRDASVVSLASGVFGRC